MFWRSLTGWRTWAPCRTSSSAPARENDEDAFGCQAVVNEHDEVEASERLLIGATGLPLERIVTIHALAGSPSRRTSTGSLRLSDGSGSSPGAPPGCPGGHPPAGLAGAGAATRTGPVRALKILRFHHHDIGAGVTRACWKAPLSELKLPFEEKTPQHWSEQVLELALHILDIAENSIRAGHVRAHPHRESWSKDLSAADHGQRPGDDPGAQRALDPSPTKKVRRVGLGLPCWPTRPSGWAGG